MNFMASSLKDSDEDQRKMISNISHDFRSPLTSIKGYIEAMLDGTIPPEMQEKYLNIVLRETERLTGLTSGLLTLNSMDGKQNRLTRSNFDINAVIQLRPLKAPAQPNILPLIFCFPTGTPM